MRLYRMEWQVQISAKNNIVNRFTKCVNRFKQQEDKSNDLWWLIQFSIYLNQFNWARDEDWYDSDSYESIQYKSEKIHDTSQALLNRFNNDTVQKLVNWCIRS